MAGYYGVSEQNLPGHLGNHMLQVDIQFEAKVSEDGKTKYDWWGVSKAFHCGYYKEIFSTLFVISGK
jgi:hypothetical protein